MSERPGDRFVTLAALPTEHEREILVILAEECAEVVQRVTKLLRFGAAERQPGQPYTNRGRLGHELGDLLEMVDVALQAGLLHQGDLDVGRLSKRTKLSKYMQTGPLPNASIANECGAISGDLRCTRQRYHDGEAHSYRGTEWL